MNTQPPNAAAGEHFAGAARILAALPLVKAARRAGSPRAYLQTRAKHVYRGEGHRGHAASTDRAIYGFCT